MWFTVGIIIICVYVLFSSKKKAPKKSRRAPAAKKTTSFALPVDKAERRFMSKNVPDLLQGYAVFSASYLSRFASRYLSSGKTARFTEDELLPGVEPERASWVLNHCLRLASARYNAKRTIKEGRAAEASSVDVKLQRACKTCDRVPAENNYSLDSDIPIYPCADCKENDICVFWYKLNF